MKIKNTNKEQFFSQKLSYEHYPYLKVVTDAEDVIRQMKLKVSTLPNENRNKIRFERQIKTFEGLSLAYRLLRLQEIENAANTIKLEIEISDLKAKCRYLERELNDIENKQKKIEQL